MNCLTATKTTAENLPAKRFQSAKNIHNDCLLDLSSVGIPGKVN
jgi:hypothetical protein